MSVLAAALPGSPRCSATFGMTSVTPWCRSTTGIPSTARCPRSGARGLGLVAPMRALGLDAMTVHWEFAYGLGGVREIAARLPYPILAANCHRPSSTAPFAPFTIVERGGIRIAVIGLAAIVAKNLLPPDERGAVELTMGDVELRALIPALHRDHAAQLIVVLSHLGFPQDCKLAATVPVSISS